MKLFILISILIIVLVHIYICIRTYQCLEYTSFLRIPVIGLIIGAVVVFILHNAGLLPFGFYFSKLIGLISSGYVFFLLFILLGFLFFDLLRVFNHFVDIIPQFIKANYILYRFIFMVLTLAATIFWFILGYLNFITPSKTELDITLNKSQFNISSQQEPYNLKVVMVSDIHIGYIINKRKLQEYVDSINNQKPDIVFIVGDLCDGAIDPMIYQNVYEELMQIKSNFGVYVVTGNHEYIGGNKDEKVLYYKKSGLIVLEDSVVLVNNNFYVVGRKDRTDKHRKAVLELVEGLDTTKPIILLDHQPFNLDKSVAAGIDLHLSGHTHDGQFFPINLITRAIYEVSHGYKLKGNTHIYVSSGLGLWGPPVRIGTKSEFVVINMHW